MDTCLHINLNYFNQFERLKACCAIILLYNVSRFTVKKLTISQQTSNVTGIFSNTLVNDTILVILVVELVGINPISETINRPQNGIVVIDSHFIKMNSFVARLCWSGLLFINSSNIQIHNVTISDSYNIGMVAQNSSNIILSSSHITNNTMSYGIYMHKGYNIIISNTTSMWNRVGIYFEEMNTTQIVTTIAANNMHAGIQLLKTININISNITISQNVEYGLVIFLSSIVHIDGIIATNNALQTPFGSNAGGINIQNVSNIAINNTVSMYNKLGIYIALANKAQVVNTIASNNRINGIQLVEIININISNATLSHNLIYGLDIFLSSSVHIDGVTVTKNALRPRFGVNSGGIFIHDVYNIVINNTISTNNARGIYIVASHGIQVVNTVASNNIFNGMYLSNTQNNNISNTTLSHNDVGLMSVSTNVHIDGIIAINNSKYGIYLFKTKWAYITRCITVNNSIKRPSAGNGQILVEISQFITIYDTIITVNMSFASSGEVTSQPAVIVLYDSTLNLSGCIFTGNRISAIRAIASNITLSGNLTFSNNSAYIGTAFILIDDSILTLQESCWVQFINNYARNTGGVFFISNTQKVTIEPFCIIFNDEIKPCDIAEITTSTCFLRTQAYKSLAQNFIFTNNSAGKGGDIVYGGNLAYGFNGKKNCMDTFKAISNISKASLSLLSSDPLRVCLCNESGLPDCMLLDDPTPRSIYSGQTISISAVVVGQGWGTVAGSVYAQFLHKSTPENKISFEPLQGVQNAVQHSCNYLHYTIFFTNEHLQRKLVLTAQDIYVSQYRNDYTLSLYSLQLLYSSSLSVIQTLYYTTNAVYINISLLPCPPGFHIRSRKPFKCDCNKLLQQIPGVHCFIQEQTIHRTGLIWVGMIDDGNATNGTIAASKYCPLNYCNKASRNVTLSEPDSQCNYNHSGTLCGRCQPGLSLALGSAQCLPCSNEYLALLIPFTLAGPVLVGFIKLLDFTISQGTINGLVFYANIIQANQDIFLPWRSTHALTIFIAWLNLDLGVGTCFFNGLDAYTKTWLQFAFPLYVWSIAGFIIILAKYSDRVAKVMGNNSVPVLATLFLLSHAKLFRTIISALSYTMVVTSQQNNDKLITMSVWSLDGNVDYLGFNHALLFTIAVAILLFLWFPYTLLLFLGQWLYKCNCRIIMNFLINIKPFLDAHYGSLKGRHRYWFGALHLVRAVILLISALVPSDHSSIVAISVSASAVLLMFFGSIVYCNSAVSLFNMAFFLNLALFATTTLYIRTSGGDPAVASCTLIGMAFLQFIGLVIFKMAYILKNSSKLMKCVRMRQCVDDDWEMYEQAALQREMESDTEEQDSESSGSTESLPTY